MINSKGFWMANMAGVIAFYGWAAWHVAQGDTGHRSALLALIILGLHVLEIPLAFAQLKTLRPAPLRVVLGTFVFGLIWWVPAKRGLFAVR